MTAGFRHEALFYDGDEHFAVATLPFMRDGIAQHQPILVAVSEQKIACLREALGSDAGRVEFVNMERLGRNPACIIPAWQAFVDEHAVDDRPLRGVGEPIWAGRTPAEVGECHAHESLLNVAFDDGPEWSLMCPYDSIALDAATLHQARMTHPGLVEGGARCGSPLYRPRSPYDGELVDPAGSTAALEFTDANLRAVRRFVADQAAAHSLDGRVDDLVLAVNELAVNSIRHGGGSGTLRIWQADDALCCEVSDSGQIEDVLAGRVRPSADRDGGAGLWLVNHLCDLVQIRSGPGGTVVRVRLGPS